jgi:hypothetical protein
MKRKDAEAILKFLADMTRDEHTAREEFYAAVAEPQSFSSETQHMANRLHELAEKIVEGAVVLDSLEVNAQPDKQGVPQSFKTIVQFTTYL